MSTARTVALAGVATFATLFFMRRSRATATARAPQRSSPTSLTQLPLPPLPLVPLDLSIAAPGSPVPLFGTSLGPLATGSNFLSNDFLTFSGETNFLPENTRTGRNFLSPAPFLSGGAGISGDFVIANVPAQPGGQFVLDNFSGPQSIFT